MTWLVALAAFTLGFTASAVLRAVRRLRRRRLARRERRAVQALRTAGEMARPVYPPR